MAAEIDVKEIYRKVSCSGLVCFLLSLPFKEVVTMQEAIAVQIKAG